MPAVLRERLEQLDTSLYARFLRLVEEVTPFLTRIESLFPHFTRHDPSHNANLERTAADILTATALDGLTAGDLFVLLCSLWVHDAGMAPDGQVQKAEQSGQRYKEFLTRGQRRGLTDAECWLEYVRQHHHEFCPSVADTLLADATPFLKTYVGLVAKSHGERTLHDRNEWPKTVSVGPGALIHPAMLGAALRMADILHFNADRAPEFMIEHRHIYDVESLRHWRAHQVSADYSIEDDICIFDGVTRDDEAYWFAREFVIAMNEEVKYCKEHVFSTLDSPFRDPLTFSIVDCRILAQGFVAGGAPIKLRVETGKLLQGLLSDALYANKPAWLREVLQNAFDASRDRKGLDPTATPSVVIRVDLDAGTVEISDTGVGMHPETVERFLLVAGASYWKSPEYLEARETPAGHVGHFGIGFMSLLGVAREIVVDTRHVDATGGRLYTIRSPDRIVRAEESTRDTAGTTVTIKLKKGVLDDVDLLATFDQLCSFPEFHTRLEMDDEIERELFGPAFPSTSTSSLHLEPIGDEKTQVNLLSADLIGLGFHGDTYIPKIHLKSLNAFVPAIRGWERTAGWKVEGDSRTILGGINYPSLQGMGSGGFALPGIGIIRLAVAAETYPLEMNLARDQLVPGEHTSALCRAICLGIDKVLATDLGTELGSDRDAEVSSAIAGRYSSALLHSWVGQVATPSYIVLAQGIKYPPLGESPWPRLTEVMMDALKFQCFTLNGVRQDLSLREMLAQERIVFAIGSTPAGIDKRIVEGIAAFDDKAMLLFGLPELDFGIFKLRRWATEQVLVPIESHSRSAFGVRLAPSSRPFAFHPGPLDGVGIPTAAGPERYVMLDYRDFMAESEARPTGSPNITATVNLNNFKARALVDAILDGIRREPRGVVHATLRALKKKLAIGTSEKYYNDKGKELVSALNDLASQLSLSTVFVEEDLPTYFNGGTSQPFGRFALFQSTIHSAHEVNALEQPFGGTLA